MTNLWKGETVAVTRSITIIDTLGVNSARQVQTSWLEEGTTIVPPTTLPIVQRTFNLNIVDMLRRKHKPLYHQPPCP